MSPWEGAVTCGAYYGDTDCPCCTDASGETVVEVSA